MSRVPRFPLSVFPEEISMLIRSMEETMGYPSEYVAGSMLVALAAAMGNNWKLEVRPGWVESPLLYMAIVGNAGANKTHPMSFALKPLVDVDLRRIAVAEASEEYFAPARSVVSDVTQEGLVKLHKRNPRGLVLFVDELKAWVANFSRYSGGSQEQFWLSNFSRTPIIVDRKSDDKPLTIPEPLISVLGSVQPSVLRAFAVGDKSTNGFVDRLLFIIKERSDKAPWSEDVMEGGFADVWSSLVESILADTNLYSCSFSEDARGVAAMWQARNVDMINSCVNEKLVGVYSKLEIHFVRFCLILQALHSRYFLGVDSLVISDEIVLKAVELAEYFRAQGVLAQEYLYPDVEAEMTEKQRLFLTSLPSVFSRREALAIAKSVGLSKSLVYKCLKDFVGVYIDINEAGDYYKYDDGE